MNSSILQQVTAGGNRSPVRKHKASVNLVQLRAAAQEASATAAKQLFPKCSGALCVASDSRTAVETVADSGNAVHGELVFAPDGCWALRRGLP